MSEEIEQATLESYRKTISQIDERIEVLRKCWREVGTEKESAILMFRSTIEEKRAVIEREEADWLRTRSKMISDFNRAMALAPIGPFVICKDCLDPMSEGLALIDDTADYGMPDFDGQTDRNGQTFTLRSSGNLHSVMKCLKCGHSVTMGNKEEKTSEL